jgi:anti-anti-sigma regulatory factor
MALKIEKDSDGRQTVIRLSGRIQAAHVDQLKTQIEGEQSGIALDLDAVTLVGVEVVGFLNACEDIGIQLHHCCPYIREWKMCERDRER